ncbi:MAG: FAD-dependent oxidoreductase [Clostridiaceae bacterium]|nr:FAD-dependent oxidoreductase [Clostridiaceae bacterium]
MKVAIIGAGLAGLYCAHELERLGVKPVIFEKNSFIGEAMNHATAVLNITHRPIPNVLEYIKKNHHLEIKPIATVNMLEHHAPNATTTLKGFYGYFFKYSKDDDSLKNQIYSKLKHTKFYFNEVGDYEKLSKKYDFVVVANGNSKSAEEMGIWQDWIRTYVRGAIILGDFDPNKLVMWINKEYFKSGYAYLCPLERQRATISVIASDVDEREIDRYWELFIYGESIKNPIVEEFTLMHNSGWVYPHQLGNIIFAGNAGGGIEPFLGFGHLNAAIMGAAAARTIALGWNYEEQIRRTMERNDEMRMLRKIFNKMTNKEYDLFVASLKIPGVNKLVYSSNVNVSKYGALIGKLTLRDPNS